MRAYRRIGVAACRIVEGVVQGSCFIEVLSAGDASRTTGDGVKKPERRRRGSG
jgi:hypothetical protein